MGLFDVILVALCVCLACYSWSLRADLQRAESFIVMYKNANSRLTEKLNIAHEEISRLRAENGIADTKKAKMPAFLSADDPWDAICREAGKLRR